jgi:hypothetical protein
MLRKQQVYREYMGHTIYYTVQVLRSSLEEFHVAVKVISRRVGKYQGICEDYCLRTLRSEMEIEISPIKLEIGFIKEGCISLPLFFILLLAPRLVSVLFPL